MGWEVLGPEVSNPPISVFSFFMGATRGTKIIFVICIKGPDVPLEVNRFIFGGRYISIIGSIWKQKEDSKKKRQYHFRKYKKERKRNEKYLG